MQKSVEGLLQTFLSQILRKNLDLVPELCSERWPAENNHLDIRDPWSLGELRQTFRRLTVHESLDNTNFVFFVDGLDEFEGSHLDLVQIVLDLARCSC
jgi:hypothetical protein